jgi:succinate dehydrogenase/fumarate reductase flavoprotein subunit
MPEGSGTPIGRLSHMNAPAVELYASRGVDLRSQMLEIALCAQHNNGGLAVDLWWQTGLPGFFAAGECAGTHGVYRPGGSALNAGQVGGARAARCIAAKRRGEPMEAEEFAALATPVLARHRALCAAVLGGADNVQELDGELSRRMSAYAGAIRGEAGMRALLFDCRALLREFETRVRVESADDLARVYRLRDALVCRTAYLSAMLDYRARGGGSRGSAIYVESDRNPADCLPDCEGKGPLPGLRFAPPNPAFDGEIQELAYRPDGCSAFWRPVRPLPEGGGVFETVWRGYRETGNVE